MMAFPAVTYIVKLRMIMSVQVCVEFLCYVLIRLVFEAGSEGQGTRLDVEAFGFTALAASTYMKALKLKKSGL